MLSTFMVGRGACDDFTLEVYIENGKEGGVWQ